MTRRYARPHHGFATPHPWIRAARDIGNLAIGVAVLGGLFVFNVGMGVYEVVRRGQGEAFRPSGGHRITRG